MARAAVVLLVLLVAAGLTARARAFTWAPCAPDEQAGAAPPRPAAAASSSSSSRSNPLVPAPLGSTTRYIAPPRPAPPRLTPSSVTLQPDPPQIGAGVVFGIQGAVSPGPPIASGTIGLRVKYEGVDLYEEEGPLCDKVGGDGCPLGAGGGAAAAAAAAAGLLGDGERAAGSIVYRQDLPPIAPPGRYEVRVIGTTGASTREGDAVVCVDVAFEMVLLGGGGAAAGAAGGAAVVAVV
jgi:hypothetical protein